MGSFFLTNVHVADRREVCGFSSVLEPVFSGLKRLVRSVVVGEVEVWNWNCLHAVGNLRVVAFFCAPLVILHVLPILFSANKKQSKAVKTYGIEEWTNQSGNQVHFRSNRRPLQATMTRRRPYDLRRLQIPTHPDNLHIFASFEVGERMAASIVVWPVLLPGLRLFAILADR